MVWLAKWIRELKGVGGRSLIVTDRKELDEQIEKVFGGVDEDIYRTTSGADLVEVLRDPAKSLICSLVHKFGSSEEGNVDQYVDDLRSHVSDDLQVPGEIFVFVDECHRTQSGKLHKALPSIRNFRWMPTHNRRITGKSVEIVTESLVSRNPQLPITQQHGFQMITVIHA